MVDGTKTKCASQSRYVYDEQIVKTTVRRWRKNLPNVEIFYAIKSNPSCQIVQTLVDLKCSFDCASVNEISRVQKVMGDSFDPSYVIFAHPTKSRESIEYALSQGVDLFVIDCVSELDKFKPEDNAGLVLRIDSHDPSAACVLASKYGAHHDEWEDIAKKATEQSLKMVGVSFHIGSGARRLDCYRQAICDARRCMDVLQACGHDQVRVCDIGGGFVSETFERAAEIINLALSENGFDDPYYVVIGEPGRFICKDAFTLYTPILSVKRNSIVIADSTYGSFNCIANDHANPLPCFDEDESQTPFRNVVVYGHSCDGADVVCRDLKIPESKIRAGEELRWNSMGAYTFAAASGFNGLQFDQIPVVV
jgi:ornithine decarboxylase